MSLTDPEKSPLEKDRLIVYDLQIAIAIVWFCVMLNAVINTMIFGFRP